MSEKNVKVEVLRGFRWSGLTFEPGEKNFPRVVDMPEDLARELAATGKVRMPVAIVQPGLASEPVPSPSTMLVRVLRPFRLMGDPVPVTDVDGNPTVIEVHGGFARQLIAAGQAEPVILSETTSPEVVPEITPAD